MDDLLASVLDSHGGVDRWARVHTITARLSIGGPFWGRKGWPEIFGEQTTLEFDTRRQHIVVRPFNGVDQRSVFDVDPERIVVIGSGVDLSKFKPGRDGTKFRKEMGFTAETPIIANIGKYPTATPAAQAARLDCRRRWFASLHADRRAGPKGRHRC